MSFTGIYDALARIPVSNGVQDVLGFTHDKLPTTIKNPPVRVIAPVSMDSTGQKHSILSFRRDVAQTWTIPDICLLGRVTQGSGHEYYYPLIMPYIDNYIRIVCQKNQKLIEEASIHDWKISFPVVPYPAGSDDPKNHFFAVVFELTIVELIANE